MGIRLSGAERAALSSAIKANIDEYCEKVYYGEHRSHLGASLIGEKCARKLWYGFRWAFKEKHSGRQLRLFNRGHKEEDRLIEWIQGIGARIWSHDENGNQFRIASTDGHFGGSLDGAMFLPTQYGLDLAFLCEFKTHNQNSFNRLVKNKVRQSHPKHFAQMSVYGKVYGFQYAIYFAICKNDDEIHVEVVELDWNLADQLLDKASRITNSRVAPGRIAASAAFSDCATCSFAGICHKNEPVELNCRSCRHAVVAPNAQWFCEKFNAILLKDKIKFGCQQWEEIEHR